MSITVVQREALCARHGMRQIRVTRSGDVKGAKRPVESHNAEGWDWQHLGRLADLLAELGPLRARVWGVRCAATGLWLDETYPTKLRADVMAAQLCRVMAQPGAWASAEVDPQPERI
jgi:hypothetical protein